MQKNKPINLFEENNSNLIDLVANQFKLDIDSVHGINHWRRVREIGLMDDLYKKGALGNLSNQQWMQLMTACTFHCLPNEKSDDITVQTCWDADRLDLWRVGIIPQKQFLDTDFAKQEEVINLWK